MMKPGTGVPKMSSSTALLPCCDCLPPSVELQCQNTGATVLIFSSHCVDRFHALQIRSDNSKMKEVLHTSPWVALLYVSFNASASTTGLNFGPPYFKNYCLPKLSAGSSALS